VEEFERHRADRQAIREPEAWLVTATARLALDRLRAQKTRRETYAGPWLPEPLLGVPPTAERDAEMASDLSLAFLVLLERLSPEERFQPLIATSAKVRATISSSLNWPASSW
jgi:RNA polymerase sigma-70 factor, ECF subfamily